MKLILTGSSGHIGGEALKQCLADSRVDQIVALVRREPSATFPKSSKIKVIIVKDFKNYEKDTLAAIEDADAAIWAMGTLTSGDPVVELDYPTTFYRAITTSNYFTRRKSPFRFSYIGGAFTEPDQTARLWFLDFARKSRGLAQTTVLKFAEAEEVKGLWVSYVVKPGGVFPAWGDANVLYRFGGWLIGGALMAWNDELGKVLVKMAVEGGEEKMISSRRIAEIARQLEKPRS